MNYSLPKWAHLPRDSKGWRMPRLGTKSAQIYDLLNNGLSSREIHAILGGSIQSIRVLVCKIKNPKVSNSWYRRRAKDAAQDER